MKQYLLGLLLTVFFIPFMGIEVQAGPGLCRASVAAPTWSEGSDVPCSVDLAGQLRQLGGGGGVDIRSTFGAVFPATGAVVGFYDGVNSQAAQVYDTYTGAGDEWTLGAVLRCAGATNSVPCLPASFTSADGKDLQTASVIHAIQLEYNAATAKLDLKRKQIFCDSYAKYDASTNGSTTLVSGSGTTTVYVCGYDVQIGGTATNWKLVYGDDANCATNPVVMTPAYQMLANSGRVVAPIAFAGLKTAAGKFLCTNSSAGNAVQVGLWYTQF